MREIKAIVRRDRVAAVLEAMHARPELPGVTVSYVEGVGRHPNTTDELRFGEVEMAKLETVVHDDFVNWIVDTIRTAAATGRPGDGKIFVIPVDRAVLIRSGDEGRDIL